MTGKKFIFFSAAVFIGTLVALAIVAVLAKNFVSDEQSSLSQTTLGKLLGL